MPDQGLNNRYDYSVYYKLWHSATEAHAASMSGYYRWLVGPWLPDGTGKSLLDVGCGMGFALRAMQDHGFERVRGIDISPEQIAACRELGLPGELVESTESYLWSCEERFDVILLLDVLEHVPRESQIPLMRAVEHVLNPDGKVVITVPNAGSPLAMVWRYQDFTHHSSFTRESLSFVLLNAGFSKIEIPGQGPLRRPSVRFWRKGYWPNLRRWFVRFLWRQILISELGPADIDSRCIELNLFCVASR